MYGIAVANQFWRSEPHADDRCRESSPLDEGLSAAPATGGVSGRVHAGVGQDTVDRNDDAHNARHDVFVLHAQCVNEQTVPGPWDHCCIPARTCLL